MDVITQTNRTMLFEEINPEKLNILTLIGDTKDLESLDDAKIKEIHENLLVRNFDEFLEKFEPVVYSFFNAATQNVSYTLEKPENIPEEYISEIPLNKQNDFLNMLFTLMDSKRAQGIINVDFKFEKILDMISPKKIMRDIKQVRKEIHYLYGEYEKLDDEDPKKLDIGDKLNYKFEEASQNYNNVMAMLPLAIEDIKTRLLLTQNSSKKTEGQLQLGMLSMGENGELKVLEIPQKEKNELLAISATDTNTGLAVAFKEDYEAVNEDPSEYVKSLVVRTFCPMTAVVDSDVDVEQEVTNYNTYLEFYKNAKDDFIKTVKPLVEKLLGVKVFFEQYNTKERGMMPTLLVCNTSLDMLVNSANIDRIKTYFNTVNNKNDYANTVWLGIVPNVELEQSKTKKVARQRFRGNVVVEKTDGNSMESLTTLMEVAKDYKIQMFFSFETGEQTTFNAVATSGVEKFVEKSRPLVKKDFSEYVSCCLPNFTIVPKEKSEVVLDNRMLLNEQGGVELSKAREDVMKLWIEGVYVGAAYAAAGIVAACQCPDYLRERFSNVSNKYPGVRYDIEAGENALHTVTTMGKEITGFTNTIKNVINSKGFGFVFASESSQVQGKEIKNITVYKARTMAMVDDVYDSLYKTMVSTYVERMLRFLSNDFKQENVTKFFSNNPRSQKSLWEADKAFVNAIIQDGDELGCEIDDTTNECNIKLGFNGDVKNLKVSVTKSTVKQG
ncbi:MAG: transcriptional regulator [Lachnospiraceae bacterium]|nr:transcriptional regulator [Lachnospiraceae bacterium]MBP5263637.1 transcriptional regulator [Lachnospiraceae bacterium]